MSTANDTADRFIRKPAVLEMTGFSPSTLYRMIKAGEFPEGVKISERARAWPESQIRAWQRQRLEDARR